jgi:hypothetical protein
MFLKNAIKRMDALPERWVRVEQVRSIRGGLDSVSESTAAGAVRKS